MWQLSFRIALVVALLIGQSLCCCSIRALAENAAVDSKTPTKSCCCRQLSLDEKSDASPAQKPDLPCRCKKSDFICSKYVETSSRSTHFEKLFVPTVDAIRNCFAADDCNYRTSSGASGSHSFALLHGRQILRSKCVWVC
jgi:hypothetical protein